MLVRRYKKGEESQILAIYYNTIHKVNIKDYNQAQINAWAPEGMTLEEAVKRAAEKNTFVAIEDDQVVGFGELDPDGYIDCFFCHHQWQGKGVGRILYTAMENEARKNGIKRLWAEASITARGFFVKMGFTVEKEQLDSARDQKLTNFVVSKELS